MPNNSRALKVLVVDDEHLIADTLRMILLGRGYDASAVYSAEEALDWCHTHCPDVVITDVVMGQMNGIQLAERLAETLPNCKALLISGHAATSDLLGELTGSGDYRFPILAKPVHPELILDFIARQ